MKHPHSRFKKSLRVNLVVLLPKDGLSGDIEIY